MKSFFLVLIFLSSTTCFAQVKEAEFNVISIRDAGTKGVYMTINLKVKDAATDDQTVVYYLMDHQDKAILHSLSDKQGVIDLNITNLKYIKSVYIGGPGHVTKKIGLTQFKGRNVVLEMVIEPDLRPLH